MLVRTFDVVDREKSTEITARPSQFAVHHPNRRLFLFAHSIISITMMLNKARKSWYAPSM